MFCPWLHACALAVQILWPEHDGALCLETPCNALIATSNQGPTLDDWQVFTAEVVLTVDTPLPASPGLIRYLNLQCSDQVLLEAAGW